LEPIGPISALFDCSTRIEGPWLGTVDSPSILAVSNSLVTGEEAAPRQREREFTPMSEIALAIRP
jgi:hypothetical protein